MLGLCVERGAVVVCRGHIESSIHPYFHPYFLRNRGFERFEAVDRFRCFSWSEVTKGGFRDQARTPIQTFDIFEGTEQIQQLVISRAISGVRIQ